MSSYATLQDLDDCGIPLAALATLDKSLLKRQLDRASGYADSFLRDSYTLPFTPPFDPGLVMAVCQLATWWLLSRRGFDPENPADKVVYQGYKDAMDWLKLVANKKIAIAKNEANPVSLQPNVSSNEPRGYGNLTGDGSTDYPAVPGFSNWGS